MTYTEQHESRRHGIQAQHLLELAIAVRLQNENNYLNLDTERSNQQSADRLESVWSRIAMTGERRPF